MLDCKVVLPVVGKALVEGPVFFSGDIGGIASPDGLSFVELLIRNLLLLNLLGFLGLFLVLVDFLDLGLLALFVLGLLFLIILNFLKRQRKHQIKLERKVLTFSTSLVTVS